jgi:hypothetical protein
MVNFFCTLWGTKYSHDYVRSLYNGVQNNFEGDFNFYCQTDHKLNIDGVSELPFDDFEPSNSQRFLVRPKVNFWKPNVWGISGRKVFLDLDIKITKNINPIIDLYREKPLIAKAWWQDNNGINSVPHNYLEYRGIINSSVIVWEDSTYTEEIWNCFKKYHEYIFFCCINGQDGYLSSMHLDKFDFIPHEYIRSYYNEPTEGASIILFDTKRANHITYGTQKEMHEIKGMMNV